MRRNRSANRRASPGAFPPAARPKGAGPAGRPSRLDAAAPHFATSLSPRGSAGASFRSRLATASSGPSTDRRIAQVPGDPGQFVARCPGPPVSAFSSDSGTLASISRPPRIGCLASFASAAWAKRFCDLLGPIAGPGA